MQDRASDIIGAATIGVGPWLPVRLSGFLAVPPRLPPLRVITALPTATATRHLPMDTATPHLPMATVRVAATRTMAASSRVIGSTDRLGRKQAEKLEVEAAQQRQDGREAPQARGGRRSS